MGLRQRLYAFAAERPAVLVVAVPRGTAPRLGVESRLRRRGWPQATSPAVADLLVVCGWPGDRLDQAIDTVWRNMPGPRAKVTVEPDADEPAIAAALDRAVRRLADVTVQFADAAERVSASERAEPQMADRAPDRDGLKLDQLHLPLGPVLPHWPAGLVINTTIQGDVVVEAEVHTARGRGGVAFWDEPWVRAASGDPVFRGAAERRRAAAHLDSVSRLLALAGWPSASQRAALLRDEVLGRAPAQRLRGPVADFVRRVGRSRSLRWMLHDLGVIGDPETYGLTGPAARYPGDGAARLCGWLSEVREAVAHVDDPSILEDRHGPRGPVGEAPSAALLAVLPRLIRGAELASARLIVASLDPDLDQLVPEMADA
jgi:hypothetical protein